jgi:hypothetical protein
VNTVLWPSFTFAFKRHLRRFDAEQYVVEAARTHESVAV